MIQTSFISYVKYFSTKLYWFSGCLTIVWIHVCQLQEQRQNVKARKKCDLDETIIFLIKSLFTSRCPECFLTIWFYLLLNAFKTWGWTGVWVAHRPTDLTSLATFTKTIKAIFMRLKWIPLTLTHQRTFSMGWIFFFLAILGKLIHVLIPHKKIELVIT